VFGTIRFVTQFLSTFESCKDEIRGDAKERCFAGDILIGSDANVLRHHGGIVSLLLCSSGQLEGVGELYPVIDRPVGYC